MCFCIYKSIHSLFAAMTSGAGWKSFIMEAKMHWQYILQKNKNVVEIKNSWGGGRRAKRFALLDPPRGKTRAKPSAWVVWCSEGMRREKRIRCLMKWSPEEPEREDDFCTEEVGWQEDRSHRWTKENRSSRWGAQAGGGAGPRTSSDPPFLLLWWWTGRQMWLEGNLHQPLCFQFR